jgi:type VI secretion system protein VasG
MADVDLKALVARLNPVSKRALETAAGICVSRTNYEVSVEHVLQTLLEDPNGDVQHILKHYGVDPGRVTRAVVSAIEGFKTGNAGRPVFSPILLDWFQLAYLIASIEHGQAEVRSGNLLEALLAKPSRLAADDYPDLMKEIGREDLRKSFDAIVGASAETAKRAVAEAAGAGKAGPATGPAGDTALAKFCTNFTERARGGHLDPVFGRDAEIRQIVDVLARRRKNNPIAVGDPGVGKTALVEGLALRIAEGDVPELLKNVELYGLDMGLLQAGASVKGEFEKRLKGVIDEVKASPKPIIMFIDEAHTLIGAGGAQGGGDAANLLKPALARGELRTIAATTWSEYKKYFEKDPALARRFQLVKVDEPSDEDAVTMLRGLKERYEKSHGVVIRDEALKAAAAMGSRYIAGRQHPDKGVDLMDTAAARVKVAISCKPGDLEDQEREVQALEREVVALERDREHGQAGLDERLGEIAARIAALKESVTVGTARWKREQEAAHAVMARRKELGDAKGPAAGEARKRLDEAVKALEAAREGQTIVPLEVTADVVASVIADWTGVPIGNMIKDEAKTLLGFEAEMNRRVKGQDHVHKIVGEGIRSAKAGLKDPEVPMGVFLFVGPSGVGKTETALGVADLMFGGERFMTTINMSEFQEKHTVSRLIGSPPGYVGYGEGGRLTEAVRQRPYSVVLLDEVEKADLEVMNLFYQVFDKGKLNDGEGREVDFKDTVIFLTSNLATDLITEAGMQDEPPGVDDLVALIRPALSKHFKPALVARMTIVPFYPLKQDALRDITRLKLGKLQRRLLAQHKMRMVIADEVIAAIAARCTEVETGARNVDHILRGSLLPRISSEILTQMSVGPLPGALNLGIGADGEFTFTFGE